MRSASWYAASKGLFDRKVANDWDTEVFQFYAGDLANAVAKASNFTPNTPIVANCKWNNSLINVNIAVRNSTGLEADLPLTCIVSVNQSGQITNLLTVDFISTFLLRVVLA